MFLIAVEVEYTLNEVLEKHGGVPLQQQVSKAKLPKAGNVRLWIHQSADESKEETALPFHIFFLYKDKESAFHMNFNI